MSTSEQQARDLLEQSGVKDAQSWSAGDLVIIANKLADLERQLAAERAKPCPHVYSGSDGTSHCTLAQADAEARAYAEKKEADLFAEVTAQQYRADTAEAQLAAERDAKDAGGRELQQAYAELRAEREARGAWEEKFQRQCEKADEQTMQRMQADARLAEAVVKIKRGINLCERGHGQEWADEARAFLSESTARQEEKG